MAMRTLLMQISTSVPRTTEAATPTQLVPTITEVSRVHATLDTLVMESAAPVYVQLPRKRLPSNAVHVAS